MFFYHLTYDAVIALGLAACETPIDAVTGPEFLETSRAIEFEGVSGTVKFEPDAGSRCVEGLKYQVQNTLSLPVNNGAEYQFQSEKDLSSIVRMWRFFVPLHIMVAPQCRRLPFRQWNKILISSRLRPGLLVSR